MNAQPPGRATWCGAIRFHQLVIPVRGYAAAGGGEGSQFRLVHAGCGQRLKMPKSCPEHGELESKDVGRAYEVSDGKLVEIDPDELESLRPAGERALVLEQAVPLPINPALYAGRTLYLWPDGVLACEAYQVLLEAMRRKEADVTGMVLMNNARRFAVIRVAGEVLAMDILKHPEEMKAAPGLEKGPIDEKAVKLMEQLLSLSAGEIDWERYKDTSAQELADLVKAKLAGKKPPKAEEPLSLTEALKRSVGEAKKSKRKAA